MLVDEYAPDRAKKQKSEALSQTKVVRETITLDTSIKGQRAVQELEQEEILIKNVGGFQESKEAPTCTSKTRARGQSRSQLNLLREAK